MVELHGVKKKSGVVVHKFFLNRAIESLHMGVHLGCSGVGVVVREVEILDLFIKVLLELRTIVGEYELHLKWKYDTTEIKEFFGGKRCV